MFEIKKMMLKQEIGVQEIELPSNSTLNRVAANATDGLTLYHTVDLKMSETFIQKYSLAIIKEEGKTEAPCFLNSFLDKEGVIYHALYDYIYD